MTDMDRYELGKPDFDVIDAAFRALIQSQPPLTANTVRAQVLRHLFSEAHTAHLELERD